MIGRALPCPESDPAGFTGTWVMSHNLWIPQDADLDFDRLLDEATLLPVNNYGGGTTSPVPLYRITKDHIVFPRAYRSRLFEIPDDIHVVDFFGAAASGMGLHPKLRPRNEAQEEALSSLLAADNGVMNLACGKGKTVLALHKIATNDRPAVVLVHNSGLAYQWRQRALEFLEGISEEDIAFIGGDPGAAAYLEVPDKADIPKILTDLDGEELRLHDDVARLTGVRHVDLGNRALIKEMFQRAGLPLMRLTKGVLQDLAKKDPLARALLRHREIADERARLLNVLEDKDLPLWRRKLVICMLQTLANISDNVGQDIRQRFGTVVFDEGHHLPADTFQRAAGMFGGQRIALTATIERDDGMEPLLFAHVGPVIYSDLQSEMPATVLTVNTDVEIGLVVRDRIVDSRRSDPHVVRETCAIKRTYNQHTRQWSSYPEISIGKLNKYLGTVAARNRIIAAAVEELLQGGRKILVLVHSPDHATQLVDVLQDIQYANLPPNTTVGAVTGETSAEGRTDIIRACTVTIATIGVAREGLDVSELDTVVFATPFTSWPIFQQGAGRCERLLPGKKQPLVLILHDNRVPMALAMGHALRKTLHDHGIVYRQISTTASLRDYASV